MLKSVNKTLVICIVIFILIIFLFQRSCSKPNTIQKVIIPEKVGRFEKADTIIVTKTKDSVIWKQTAIKTENPINKKMAAELIDALKYKDSVKVLKMYLEAIQERDGTYVYDNTDLKLEIFTKTRGEILSIKPSYKIKEREEKVLVKNKETVFALYGGLGLETTTDLNTLTPQVNLGFQNNSGNILMFEYGITDKSVGAKYIHRFINIKK
ncbi:MAG TPA: hypothetical protein VLA48_03285 [Nitrososphaeraceae archaeon]|nr:hypothetical protein [Nitrososphaeraceae archaeon]